MSNEEDNLIDDLILAGGLEISGIDEKSGEFLYTITKKMKDLMPELYEDHLAQVNEEIMNLWEKGFVNVDMMSEDPLVTLTEKAYNVNEVSKLTKEEFWSLEEVRRILDPKV
jgi:hypothetical protein